MLSSRSIVQTAPNDGSHKFCFKLITNATGSKKNELVMDADNTNLRMKWIVAIESIALELKEFEEYGPNVGSYRHFERVSRQTSELVTSFIQSWMNDDEVAFDSLTAAGMNKLLSLLFFQCSIFRC